jgi:hypothetical protein
MGEPVVLLVGRGPFEEEGFRRELTDSLPCRVCCVARVEDASALLRAGEFSLALVHVEGPSELGAADQLLWSCSLARRPTPVVAVSAAYREPLALVLFRMGVTDYLGLAEHRGRLRRLLPDLAGLTGQTPARPSAVARSRNPSGAV